MLHSSTVVRKIIPHRLSPWLLAPVVLFAAWSASGCSKRGKPSVWKKFWPQKGSYFKAMTPCSDGSTVLSLWTRYVGHGESDTWETLLARVGTNGKTKTVATFENERFNALACQSGRVFLGDIHGRLLAYALSSQKILWKTKGDLKTSRKSTVRLGVGDKTVVTAVLDHDNHLFFLRAYDLQGKLLWTLDRRTKRHGAYLSALFERPDGVWAVGLNDELLLLDPRDMTKYKFELPKGVNTVIPWKGKRWLAAGSFGIALLSGSKVSWRLPLPEPVTYMTAGGQGLVYCATHEGMVFAVDLEKQRLRWFEAAGKIDLHITTVGYSYRSRSGRHHRIAHVPRPKADRVIGWAPASKSNRIYVALARSGIVTIPSHQDWALPLSSLAPILRRAMTVGRICGDTMKWEFLRTEVQGFIITFAPWLMVWLLTFLGVTQVVTKDDQGRSRSNLSPRFDTPLSGWWNRKRTYIWVMVALAAFTAWQEYALNLRGVILLKVMDGFPLSGFLWVVISVVTAVGAALLPLVRWGAALTALGPWLVTLPLWALGAYSPKDNPSLRFGPHCMSFVLGSVGLAWTMILVGALSMGLLIKLPLWRRNFECEKKKRRLMTWISWTGGFGIVLALSRYWVGPVGLFVHPPALGLVIYLAVVGVTLWPMAAVPGLGCAENIH